MSDSHGSSTKAILYALLANSSIALAKTGGAIYTGSGSMLAEAIHSYADVGNQVLLLLGMHRAKRPPTREHPLGFGKVTYFWSFMVAVMLFSLGGLFSIYEGFHKLHSHEPLHQVWVGLLILGVSIVLEIFSMYGCVREINKLRGKKTLWQWLLNARQAELVVVFGENLAALLGLTVAFVFLLLAFLTGNPIYDALGSIAIGAILLVISVFVAIRVKALLIGRAADPEIATAIESMLTKDADIERVLNIITMQFGPQMMLAAKIQLRGDLSMKEGVASINRLERGLRERFLEIGWIFMEPDTAD